VHSTTTLTACIGGLGVEANKSKLLIDCLQPVHRGAQHGAGEHTQCGVAIHKLAGSSCNAGWVDKRDARTPEKGNTRCDRESSCGTTQYHLLIGQVRAKQLTGLPHIIVRRWKMTNSCKTCSM